MTLQEKVKKLLIKNILTKKSVIEKEIEKYEKTFPILYNYSFIDFYYTENNQLYLPLEIAGRFYEEESKIFINPFSNLLNNDTPNKILRKKFIKNIKKPYLLYFESIKNIKEYAERVTFHINDPLFFNCFEKFLKKELKRPNLLNYLKSTYLHELLHYINFLNFYYLYENSPLIKLLKKFQDEMIAFLSNIYDLKLSNKKRRNFLIKKTIKRIRKLDYKIKTNKLDIITKSINNSETLLLKEIYDHEEETEYNLFVLYNFFYNLSEEIGTLLSYKFLTQHSSSTENDLKTIYLFGYNESKKIINNILYQLPLFYLEKKYFKKEELKKIINLTLKSVRNYFKI